MGKPQVIADTNPDWFKARLTDRGLSLRGGAKLLDMDSSAFHHLIHGRRKFSAAEAADVAKLLGVPLSEVFRNAGLQVEERPEYCDISEVVDNLWNVGPRSDKARTPLPWSIAANTKAVRCEDHTSVRYGWVFYYVPQKTVPADVAGQTCVCVLKNGKRCIRTVLAGFEPNRFNLVAQDVDPIEGAELTSASAIEWVKL